jgi:four helix bundle protein
MQNERSYKDLIVWQKAIALSLEIYQVTKSFPKEELYALSDQMRRAAVSIPSNIAEGRSRRTSKDFTHSLHIALGSAAELDTQLLISRELFYCRIENYEKIEALLSEVRRMLHAMIKGLEARG